MHIRPYSLIHPFKKCLFSVFYPCYIGHHTAYDSYNLLEKIYVRYAKIYHCDPVNKGINYNCVSFIY